MFKKTFTLCVTFILLFSTNIFPQYNNEISAGKAPWTNPQKQILPGVFLANPTTLGYAFYYSSGSILFRFNTGTPGITTPIGTAKPYFFGNGDFANPTGVWKFYTMNQYPSPYIVYEVDTATGNITNVGEITNIKSGHMPIDMEWDQTTNTMYLVSANNSLTETQFYSMYWPTKVLTWIGSPVTTPAAIIAGGFNAYGTYFGIDLMTDALWKVNKNTGAWTQIGPLGYSVNYGQDAGFDRSDYSKMLWCACGGTVGLYEVDTTTAAINLIGTFPYTQVIGAGFIPTNGPQIALTGVQNIQTLGPYTVTATATPYGAGITSVKIYYSRNSTALNDSITMTNAGGYNWSGNIPGGGGPATYNFYLWAKDALNRTAKAPANAPTTYYTFTSNAVDTVKPVIVHTPIGGTPKFAWPVVATATVTDNFGIDSAWVRWRINSTVNRQFRLTNTSGNTFSAVFNSVNADVNPGDTIYYRIIAQDRSANHNRDSSALYSFLIIPWQYICMGTGTVQMSSGSGTPFNTYWWGNRTQMLWTASELSLAGALQGNVLKIGFQIASNSTQVMNGFTIKMQNTSLTSLNGFILDNWTTVYFGSYTVPGTGWQLITLTTPFYWDGSSSLLTEICFSNTSYTTPTVVYGTTNPGKEYTEFHDTPNACTDYISPALSNARPNACFDIQSPSGSNNNNGIIPARYKLSQNYPNPFNPATRISFDIPKNGFVSLKIFDILGREVKLLVSEMKSAGSYSVDFDASGLPSGIYLYRLESNGFIDTKRMVLIK